MSRRALWDCFMYVSEGREWGVGSVVVGSVFGAPPIFGPDHSETIQNKVLGGGAAMD